MTTTPTLPDHAIVTEYELSRLPTGHHERGFWSVKVQRRPGGRWAVTHSGDCYDLDGNRDPEWGARGDGWEDTHWFDLPTALDLADRVLDEMRFNGLGWADVLTMDEMSRGEAREYAARIRAQSRAEREARP